MSWYDFPIINNYGSPDPYGGFPKPDINVTAPAGTPITALFSGTVSGINAPDGSIPSWGNVVTVKLDSPINSVATHTAYLHLASLANVKVGQHISAGQVVGYSGGTNPGAGLQQASVGFALYNGDYYGYGSSWNQFLGSSWLNPTALWNSITSGNITIPTSVSSLLPGLNLPDLSGFTAWFSNPARLLKMIMGLLLVGISLVLLVAPEQTQTFAKSLVKV